MIRGLAYLFLCAAMLTARHPLLLAAESDPAPAQAPSSHSLNPVQLLEYTVKSAFIINFARYTRWPKPATKLEEISTLSLYTTALWRLEVPFNAQKNREVGSQTLVLSTLPPDRKIEDNSILFISQDTSPQEVESLLALTRGRPILTIGEADGMAEAGCMINIIKIGKKLRFEVNQEACRQGGIQLSSELLKLARIVRPKGEAK